MNICSISFPCSRQLFHFPFNIKEKSNDALSFNLPTIPKYAGYYGKPIDEWVRQGHTCKESAWEKICLESSEKKISKYNLNATNI